MSVNLISPTTAEIVRYTADLASAGDPPQVIVPSVGSGVQKIEKGWISYYPGSENNSTTIMLGIGANVGATPPASLAGAEAAQSQFLSYYTMGPGPAGPTSGDGISATNGGISLPLGDILEGMWLATDQVVWGVIVSESSDDQLVGVTLSCTLFS